MRPLSHYGVAAGGLLILLSSIPHAFLGWPALAGALEAAAVDAEIRAGLSMGWYFGSVAMVVLGAVALLAFRALPAGAPVAWQSACAVGLGYLGFGVAAFAYRGSPHFLGFVAIGGLLALCALAARR